MLDIIQTEQVDREQLNMEIKLDWRYDKEKDKKFLVVILFKDGVEVSRDEIDVEYLK